MAKFTIIHMVLVGSGNIRSYMPKYRRVNIQTSKGDKLEYYLNREKLDVHYIFHGWPKLEGETTPRMTNE